MSTRKKKTPAWQRKEGQKKSGGLNAKGRASYEKQTGGTLRPPAPNPKSKKSKTGATGNLFVYFEKTVSPPHSSPDLRLPFVVGRGMWYSQCLNPSMLFISRTWFPWTMRNTLCHVNLYRCFARFVTLHGSQKSLSRILESLRMN